MFKVENLEQVKSVLGNEEYEKLAEMVYSDLINQLNEYREEIKGLKERNRTLEDSLYNSETALEEVQEELYKTEKLLEKNETELEDTKEDLQNVSNELEEIKGDLEDTNDELGETVMELRDLRGAVMNLLDALDELSLDDSIQDLIGNVSDELY